MRRTAQGVELTEAEAAEVAGLLGYAAVFIPRENRRDDAARMVVLILRELEAKPCT